MSWKGTGQLGQTYKLQRAGQLDTVYKLEEPKLRRCPEIERENFLTYKCSEAGSAKSQPPIFGLRKAATSSMLSTTQELGASRSSVVVKIRSKFWKIEKNFLKKFFQTLDKL